MITPTEQEKLIDKIKGLTELEFTTLFEELGDHIQTEGWYHVIKKYFCADDYENQIEDLNETIETLEDDIKRLNDQVFEQELDIDNLKAENQKLSGNACNITSK